MSMCFWAYVPVVPSLFSEILLNGNLGSKTIFLNFLFVVNYNFGVSLVHLQDSEPVYIFLGRLLLINFGKGKIKEYSIFDY